jgi:hypothetical protein
MTTGYNGKWVVEAGFPANLSLVVRAKNESDAEYEANRIIADILDDIEWRSHVRGHALTFEQDTITLAPAYRHADEY